MSNFRPSFLSSMPPVSKNLIAINVILFLASFVAPTFFNRFGIQVDLNDILGMHYWESTKFNPAQFITYAFMHGGFFHILFNMFAVYMFGGVLEHLWGPKRFLIYYLITAIGAGLVQQLFWTIEYHSVISALKEAINTGSTAGLTPVEGILRTHLVFEDLTSFNSLALLELKNMFQDSMITIGASGSVFGLLLAFGWLFPEQNLYLMFIPVPIKARIFVLIYGLVELFQGVANFAGDNVAHFAHLGGMLFGAILIIIWKKKKQY